MTELDRRGPPFSAAELNAARMVTAGNEARVPVNSAWLCDRPIPHLQRRGLVSVKVVDQPHAKPAYIDVSLTPAARAALASLNA